MDEMGFYLSDQGFKGPFLEVDDIRAGKPIKLSTVNLYCIKKTLRDSLSKASGRRRQLMGVDSIAAGAHDA